MKILEFIFSNFWYFIGIFLLLSVITYPIGNGIGMIGRKRIYKCKCKYCKNFKKVSE